jgi:hypothetical protein
VDIVVCWELARGVVWRRGGAAAALGAGRCGARRARARGEEKLGGGGAPEEEGHGPRTPAGRRSGTGPKEWGGEGAR